MNFLKRLGILLLAIGFSNTYYSQVVNDSFCIQDGIIPSTSIFSNDDPTIQITDWNWDYLQEPTNCVSISQEGFIQVPADLLDDCCGVYELYYNVFTEEGITFVGFVTVEIKCGKPDCSIINLSDYVNDLPAGGENPDIPEENCISVCEFSQSTFYFPFDPNKDYTWDVGGEITFAPGAPGELIVDWGPAGAGYINVTILDLSTGIITFHSFCVDILPGPSASFVTPGYACLGSPMSFTNTSTDGSIYNWDFGDGQYSDLENPNHVYTSPGTYTVTLCVTRLNYDDAGNPLCCCVDCYSVDVEVDELPGPGIFWISTLCEGDSSKYWTDATNCSNYTWTVEDEFGSPITFTGQGNDTICVTWTTGNFGTITLDVDDCDQDYCDNPTTVTVPIIPNVSVIDGPTVVCEFSTHTYTLPKWFGTDYQWVVLDQDGNPVPFDGQGSHIITVHWGSQGLGNIHVDYNNSFLNGLPNHPDGNECTGVADLNVLIRPEFDLVSSGSLACVNGSSNVFATSTPSSDYTWTIDPAVPFTGQGTSNININWITGPGTYVITAISNDPGAYCNSEEVIVINVIEPDPIGGIDGATEVCLSPETYYYQVLPANPAYSYTWSVSGGTPTFGTGTSIGVQWTSPGTITVQGQMTSAPYCSTDPFTISVNEKIINGPLVISGTATCTNSIGSYSLSPAQHPDANITWQITDPTDGSIVAGQGTDFIDVQWNNDAGPVFVDVVVELCGNTQSVSLPLNLVDPIVPNIIQNGNLCPGVSADLEVSPAIFNFYDWSTGTSGPSADMTTIFSGGTYSVTTTDVNGCLATSFFEANEIPGAVAGISSADNPNLCVPGTGVVTIQAQTNPNYEFEWFCSLNGGPFVSQGPFSTQSFLDHTNMNNVGATYCYYFDVIDTSTGCTNTSDMFYVYEDDCTGMGGCTPEPYSLGFTSAYTSPPLCDTWTFTPITSNATVTSWYFGDGSPLSGSNTHTYSEAGCYNVTVYANVPELGNPGSFCQVSYNDGICVPLAADFDFEYLNCTDVKFTDFSTYIGVGNSIVSRSWSFGGSGLTMETASFTPGSHNITLTVTDANGCVAQSTKTINIGAVSISSINAISSPNPPCPGTAIDFSAVAPGAVDWFWDFGDGASYSGPNPLHSYTVGGTSYTVTLTVTDEDGCTDTQTLVINVVPGISPQVLSPGGTICSGDSFTITAPLGFVNYEWSNGQNGPSNSLTVTSTDDYSVILTDADGCTLELDAVRVEVIDGPVASISGSPFICDTGCTTLSTPFNPNYAYQWYDAGGPIFGANNNTHDVCSGSINNSYFVEVTDLITTCKSISDPFDVFLVASPSFTITASPDLCEGQPITLSVNPLGLGFPVSWSNGASGEIITVSTAGFYTATMVDPGTGCSHSETIEIYPKPDLCMVPTGCYTVCEPDTICGPEGLASYNWIKDGLSYPSIPGMPHCIEVTMDGIYNLTATNIYGCECTSEDLILEVIDCDTSCDDLEIQYSYLSDSVGEIDSCCVTLHYQNDYGNIQGMNIYTSDSDFNFDLGSIDPSLNVQSVGSNNITLNGLPLGTEIPTGVLFSFIDFCIENPINNPQEVIVDWFDFDDMVVCSDTLTFHCPVEPPCLYFNGHDIYCEDGQTIYQVEFCNPSSNPYSIGYIDLSVISPGGLIVSPSVIDITGSPLNPGDCQTFTLNLSGVGIAGETFCYQAVAHENDPNIDPTTWCCPVDEIICIEIPPCDPCEDVFVNGVDVLNDDGCCYQIYLENNYSPTYFDEIAVCVNSPSTTMTVNNPFGSGWTSSGYTPTGVSFIPDAGFAPGGVFNLPEICIDTYIAPSQELLVKWMHEGEVVCTDTVLVDCEPDCGYLIDEFIECDPDGFWIYSGQLKSKAPYIVNEAVITFNDPALSAYNTTIPLGAMNHDDIVPITLNIGFPAMAGDEICFTVTLHEISPDGQYLNCCNFTHCITLPDCGFNHGCNCDDEFFLAVQEGISCTMSAFNNLTYEFSLINPSFFEGCDTGKWGFGDGSDAEVSYGNNPVSHTFPGPGVYQVCVRVRRIADNGEICQEKVCKWVTVGDIPMPQFEVFPNPNDGMFFMKVNESLDTPVNVSIFDLSQRQVFVGYIENPEQQPVIEIDLQDQSRGMYFMHIQVGEEIIVKRIITH